MSNQSNQPHFHFPISTLEKESDLILTAAEGDTYAAALADRLDAGLVASGRTLWNTLFKPQDAGTPPAEPTAGSSAAQKEAHSDIGTYTQEQKDALAAYRPLAHQAREAGKTAFKGNNVKLHDEFRVGVDPGSKIDKIVSEGRLLLAGVRNPANTAALKSKAGYIAKDSDALEATLSRLAGTETNQEDAKGKAKGATDVRRANLNQLYDTVITIQSAAENEFPNDRQARTAFRLGIFPPKEKGGDGGGGVNPPGGGGTSGRTGSSSGTGASGAAK